MMRLSKRRQREIDWGIAHLMWKSQLEGKPEFGPARMISRPDCAACHLDRTGACNEHLWF